jgi:hypothetical protein
MLVPLYGFLKGDTIGLIVLVQDSDTVADVARCLQQAAAVRVRPSAAAEVWFEGHRLDPAQSVAAAGLSALDRVDVVPLEAP